MSDSIKRGVVVCLCLAILLMVTEALNAFEKGRAELEASPDPSAIGCILPLTGRYAAYGNRALEAIVLAAGFFDPGRKCPFKLLIEDSEGQPEKAKEAVIRLAMEGRVIAILGPPGGAEAFAAAEEAQRRAVPIITLTQKEGVTDAGSYVFRYCLSGPDQIRTLVQYALSQRGWHSFAVLYPRDTHGQEMARLFQEEVAKGGGEIRHATSYDKADTDFAEQIREIAGLPPPTGEGEMIEEEKPRLDFTALFIPDTAARVGLIASQLAFHGITGVQLLGTSGWSSAELLQSGSEYLEGAIFVDGFFPNGATPAISDFVDAFYTVYAREPGVMDALAYDAMAMFMRIMVEKHVDTRDRFRDAVLQVKDYTGVTGRTSFSTKRDAQKDVFILTVKDGQIVQVK